MSILSQRSLAGGEIGPELYARTDTTKFQSGVRTMRNATIMRSGGAQSRGGFEYLSEVKDSTKTVRLIPFVFNSAQSYVLEFGNLYMRVYRDGEQMLETTANTGGAFPEKTITGITQANPAVVTTSGAHGWSTGNEVRLLNIVGMTELNGKNVKITVLSGTTFSIQTMAGANINSTAYGAFTSGQAARVHTVTTLYVEADLPELRFIQSGDVLTVTHPSYDMNEFQRADHAIWSRGTVTLAPGISSPAIVAFGAPGTAAVYKVTAVNTAGEESLPSASAGSNVASPNTVQWVGNSGDRYYNVYKKLREIYGFIGITADVSFVDTGITPDVTINPPEARDPFTTTDNYPTCVTYFQQRLGFAGTNADPETAYFGRPGFFKNFCLSYPAENDSPVTFTPANDEVNRILHMIDAGRLMLFTSGGYVHVEGDESGVLRPSAINCRQRGDNGISRLRPLRVGQNVLYVDFGQSIVRDVPSNLEDEADDRTIFAPHLVDGYTLSDWTLVKRPHPIVWAVRSDGALLGMTYVRKQEIWGWHRHDTDGTFENVCAIPEGRETALYAVVKRTINDVTKRYVERMHTRQIDDIEDFVALDSSISFDGWNAGATTMTLSGGTNWTYDEALTLTASASFFLSTDVGNKIFLRSGTTVIRCEITAYTSATVVTVHASETVPVALRSATTDWAEAVDELTGLDHLEGKDVAVFADSCVVASPNNADYTVMTVTNGALTLPTPRAKIHVGLPYLVDIETLDIDTAEGGGIAELKKLVTEVTLKVFKSRGIWAGTQPPSDDDDDPLERLSPAKIRNTEDYNEPVALKSGNVRVKLQGSYTENGRIFIRQVDPVPLTLLSISATGFIPIAVGGK